MALHSPRNKHVSVVQYRRGVQAAGGGEGPRREVLKLSTSREVSCHVGAPAIGSAKLSGLDPEAHLRDFLTHIADHPITRIEELLLWNIAVGVPPAIEPAT
jgi:hypothetical protein